MKTPILNFKKSSAKKVIIATLFVGALSPLFAQMVVTDVGNERANEERRIQLVKQLQEAQEQSTKLQTMRETLKKNLEMLQDVNDEVKNIYSIKSIAKKQAGIFNRANAIKKSVRNNPNIETILYAEKATNQILEQTKGNIQQVSSILSSGVFNMGDGERITLLKKYEEDTDKSLGEMKAIESTLERIDFAYKVYNMKRK